MKGVFVSLLCCLCLYCFAQRNHIIQRGETFELIAKRYGISVGELKAANPDDECFTGMKIIIPEKKIVHRIEKPRHTDTAKKTKRRRSNSSTTTSSGTTSMGWNYNPFGMMSFGPILTPFDPGYFQFDFAFPTYDYKFDFSNTPIYNDEPTSVNTNPYIIEKQKSDNTHNSGHKCRLCDGTGKKISEPYLGNTNSTKWCSDCQKTVYVAHSHIRCDLCGGDGWCE
jgi:hypothetical protein